MRQILVFSVLAIAAIFLLSFSASADEPVYENPELELKFNWKEEGDVLSPQTKLPADPEATKSVTADHSTLGPFLTDRGPVNVGTWTSEPVEFDISMSINSFDIWWQTQESGDDSCVWTISIEVNGAQISEDDSDCQDDGSELSKRTHNLATNVDLVAGDTIGMNLVYEGWDDIKIHYDNTTYDTGLNIAGKHNFFFTPSWSGTTVSIEFAEAWPVNWNTNLDGGYIMLMGDEMYMADNSKANVVEGNEYTIQMANGSADITSTIITWTEVTGIGIQLMMDYTTFDHMAGNSSANGTVKPALVTLSLEKAAGILGDEDGLLGLPGFEIAIAIPAIIFVARKFRN